MAEQENNKSNRAPAGAPNNGNQPPKNNNGNSNRNFHFFYSSHLSHGVGMYQSSGGTISSP